MLKVVFLGTPQFAIPSLEILFKTEWIDLAAVCTQPDREAGRGKNLVPPKAKTFAVEHGVNLFQTEKISKDPELINKIVEIKPDLMVTCAFGQILNQKVLDIAPVFNVHASLLPKYRGAAPINWAILNGEIETGITIMKTELSLDSGPILIQEKCEIGENETSVDLFNKLSILGSKTLITGLEKIKSGNANFILQDESKVTFAPMLNKELGKINWDKSSKDIHNQIRGLQPWPSAFTSFESKMIKVWGSKLEKNTISYSDFSPGQIVEISENIKVKTGDGIIVISSLQPENKKAISPKDWCNGARVKIGDKFK